jgi:soluble lytic murein transglycosylase-like protein
MEEAVSRYSGIGLAITALAATQLEAPALADVLEISGSQSTWVAGGPRSDNDLVGTAPSAELPGPVPSAASAIPMTQFTDSAGPAAWRARVGQLASKYDLSPALLEAVVWQESRWREGATSPKGAHGLAQLMPGTARDLGVDPRDPSANLEGGARYLRLQLDSFGGDVEKALAAYNAGPGRVRRAGGIPAIAETRAYVAAILGRMNRSIMDPALAAPILADPVRR